MARSSPCFSSLAPIYLFNENENMSAICANEHKSCSWPFKKCLVEEHARVPTTKPMWQVECRFRHFQTYMVRNGCTFLRMCTYSCECTFLLTPCHFFIHQLCTHPYIYIYYIILALIILRMENTSPTFKP